MSFRDVNEAQDELKDILRPLIDRGSFGPGVKEDLEEKLDTLVEAFKTLAERVADERMDREFNRGDWRS